MSTLRLTLEPAALTADVDARRVAGLVVPYGVPGNTSLGRVRIRAGALDIPEEPSRVKLLLGHDRDRPCGAAVQLEDGADRLVGTFAVARTADGDTLLAELDPDAPTRDGLSVELDDVVLAGDEVTAGRLVAVAAVPLPAFTDARSALAAEDHPTPTPEDPMPDTATAAVLEAPTPAVEAAEAPARSLTAPAAPARTAPVSALVDVTRRLTAARLDGNTALRAALADITPTGNGAGNTEAGLMVQALGELWSGVAYESKYRPLLTPGALTGIRAEGFNWNPPPTVADYAGDKAAVPSNAAKLEYYSTQAQRLAGAHDIDRIYRDLGDEAVLRSYWRLMAESLAMQIDAKALNGIVAAAGTPTALAGGNLWQALVRGTLAVSSYGQATFALAASDVVEDAALTTADTAPVGPNPFGLQVPSVTPAPELPSGTVVVGIRNALRCLTFEPPIRVEAVNIPNGGIDAGLFSYVNVLDDNVAAVVAYTV